MQCIVRHCEHYLLVCPNAEELIGIPLVLHINKSSLRRQFAVVCPLGMLVMLLLKLKW